MKMLSIIIQEYLEGRQFVQKMVAQAASLPMTKEIIFVTSKSYSEFTDAYGPFSTPVTIFGNIQSPGSGRTIGAAQAVGDTLLFMDCHTCFDWKNTSTLLATLDRHPDAIVGPGIRPVEFPSCQYSPNSGIGYGIAYRFTSSPFEHMWLPAETTQMEFKVPFICACMFAARKTTMDHLRSYGGFLTPPTGVGWEEEIAMRLWRLGHEALVEPRATFGHYFKGYTGHTTYDEHSQKGTFFPRVAGAYINIFDPVLWRQVESFSSKKWGESWYKNLELAKQQYGWLHELMRPLAGKVNERWFFRT